MDYTVTITPKDDSGTTTTLTVENSTGEARITSVLMTSPTGLTGGQMPTVDVGLLLQAVSGPTSAPSAITATPPPALEATPQEASEPADTRTADADVEETPATVATPMASTAETTPQASPSATAPAKRASRHSSAEAQGARTATGARKTAGRAAEDTTTPAPRARRSQQPAKKTAPKKAPRAQKATAATGGSARAYRRMPDDFAAVFAQASTPAAIVDHYGVPRHTASHWINRFTKQQSAASS